MLFNQAKNYRPVSSRQIDLIVLHDMEYPEKAEAAEWLGDYFGGRKGMTAPRASTHYGVDSDSIVQYVHDHDVAWGAPGANRNGIHIEHAGYARQTAAEWADPYSKAMLNASQRLCASLCLRYDLPVRYVPEELLKAGTGRGITTHAAVSRAFGLSSHWDPGPNFPIRDYVNGVGSLLGISWENTETPDQDPEKGYVAFREAPMSEWTRVELDGKAYMVAPDYIYPVSLAEGQKIARRRGCVLPTPSLVDVIWEAATHKLDAGKFPQQFKKWTYKEMNSPAAYLEHKKRVEKELGETASGLVAGHCKDIVSVRGKVGIYGWHRHDGRVIQSAYLRHDMSWKDYSQGLRLVREV